MLNTFGTFHEYILASIYRISRSVLYHEYPNILCIIIVYNILINAPTPEPQRHVARHRHEEDEAARHRHEEDEACGREKPAGIAEIHFRQSAPPFLSLFGIFVVVIYSEIL